MAQDNYWYTGEKLKVFRSIRLGPEDIVIDCGANIGNVTDYFCKSGAYIYAFEPNPYAFRVLKDRFNGVENVCCVQKAVSNSNGIAKLYLHEKTRSGLEKDQVKWSHGSSLKENKVNVLADKYVEVEVVDICEFIKSLNRDIRILKLDVEGCEYEILLKIINTDLIRRIDYIFLETHHHKIPGLETKADAVGKLIKERGIKNIIPDHRVDWR